MVIDLDGKSVVQLTRNGKIVATVQVLEKNAETHVSVTAAGHTHVFSGQTEDLPIAGA